MNTNKPLKKINYYLKIERIIRKCYLLKVTIKNEDLPWHTAMFTNGVEEEAYLELFEQIRYKNKINNQEAYLHIPNNWCDHDYNELLECLNCGYSDNLLSRDGTILVNNPL